LFVELIFGVRQVETREQWILVEQKIGNGHVTEHVELADTAKLVDALEQEVKLRRQRVTRGILVEARQKRIVFRTLQQRVARQARGELPRKAGLAGADRTVDDDIAALGDVHDGSRGGSTSSERSDARYAL